MLPHSAAGGSSSSGGDPARGRALASRRRRCGCRTSVAIAMAVLLVFTLATLLVLRMMPGRPGAGARSALRAAKQRVVKALEAAQDGRWPQAEQRAHGQAESRPPVQEDDRHRLEGQGSFGNVGGVVQPLPPAPLMAAAKDEDTVKDKDTDKKNSVEKDRNDSERQDGKEVQNGEREKEMEVQEEEEEGKYGNERWRGNNYVGQRGVLPYERCGAGQFSPGPRPTTSDFSFAGETYSLVMLGATTWGASDGTGKPTTAESVQLLLYWQHKKDGCDVVHASKHCILPEVWPLPRMRCRIRGEDGGWRDGLRDPRPNTTRYRQIVPVDPVYCPLPRGVDSLKDRFVLELQFGDEAGEDVTTSVDMCYLHVRRAVEVTICMAPQFGYGKDSQYWAGNPAFDGYSMLESFVLWHSRMFGIDISIYDTERELSGAVEAFRGWGNVTYRPQMGLFDIQHRRQQRNGTYNPYTYQTQSEIACVWEQRTRSKWVMLMHSADCYLYPEWDTFAQTIAKIDPEMISEVQIPRIDANSDPSKPHTPENSIVLRFPLMSRGGLIKQKEFTPIGNPRDFDASNVHVFTANRTSAKGTMSSKDVLMKLNLRTIHMMAASRPITDRKKGRRFERFAEFGLELQELIVEWNRTRPSGPWDHPMPRPG